MHFTPQSQNETSIFFFGVQLLRASVLSKTLKQMFFSLNVSVFIGCGPTKVDHFIFLFIYYIKLPGAHVQPKWTILFPCSSVTSNRYFQYFLYTEVFFTDLLLLVRINNLFIIHYFISLCLCTRPESTILLLCLSVAIF